MQDALTATILERQIEIVLSLLHDTHRHSLMIKPAAFLLVLFSILAAPPARGQSINLATIKCRELIELSKETIATLTVWLDGYYTDEEDAAVFEPDKLKIKADKLAGFCAQNPKMSVMMAAENVMAK
jgi:acid stress chaperone HdeB